MKNQANKPYFDALIVSCHIIVFFKVKYALIVHEMILKKLINGLSMSFYIIIHLARGHYDAKSIV